jgi:cell division protein FtsZ
VMLPGLINLDFADVRTTMIEAGDAILGIGMGYGEHRATIAAEKAVSSPLLETSVEGARSLLLSITGGPDLALIEASEAADIVKAAAHPEAEIIFGASVDEDMSEEVWITVIATRFDDSFSRRHRRDRRTESREPRTPDRDAALRPERYADPVGDYRGSEGSAQPRRGSADELYGDGVWGRNPSRPPTQPRPLDGQILDVPEFKPEQ